MSLGDNPADDGLTSEYSLYWGQAVILSGIFKEESLLVIHTSCQICAASRCTHIVDRCHYCLVALAGDYQSKAMIVLDFSWIVALSSTRLLYFPDSSLHPPKSTARAHEPHSPDDLVPGITEPVNLHFGLWVV